MSLSMENYCREEVQMKVFETDVKLQFNGNYGVYNLKDQSINM